ALMIFPLPVLLGLMVVLATVGVVFATMLFPIGGGLTIAAYTSFEAVFADSRVSRIVPMFAFSILGIPIFVAAMVLEGKVSQNRLYRRLRYTWRMLTAAGAGYYFAGIVTGGNAPIVNVSWSEVPRSQIVIVIVFLLSMHFLSRKLDRGYDGKNVTLRQAVLARKPIPRFRESPVGAADEEVQRRIGILRKYLDGLEEAGLANSRRAEETRAGLRDLNDLLDFRESNRALL